MRKSSDIRREIDGIELFKNDLIKQINIYMSNILWVQVVWMNLRLMREEQIRIKNS